MPIRPAPSEVNVMLNAQHPGFSSLKIQSPALFLINSHLALDALEYS